MATTQRQRGVGFRHLRNSDLPIGVVALRELRKLSPLEQANKLKEDAELRKQFLRSNRGREWLKKWDHQQTLFDGARAILLQDFHVIRSEIDELGNHIGTLATQLGDEEYWKAPITPPELQEAEEGKLRSMVTIDSNGEPHVEHTPQHLHHRLGSTVLTCRDQISRLARVRENQVKEEYQLGTRKPRGLIAGALASVGLVGGATYWFGASPVEIVKEQKDAAHAAAKEEMREVVQSTVEQSSPAKLKEAIHAWRTDENNPLAKKIFSLLYNQARPTLAQMAQDISKHSDSAKNAETKIDVTAFELQLGKLEQNPADLEEVIEYTLADAVINVLKISNPKELETVLTASPNPKILERDLLLANFVGALPRFAWSTVSLGTKNLPVNATTNSKFLTNTKADLETLAETEEKARQALRDQEAKKNLQTVTPAAPGSTGATGTMPSAQDNSTKNPMGTDSASMPDKVGASEPSSPAVVDPMKSKEVSLLLPPLPMLSAPPSK